jgi:hypothetical protein
MEALIYLSKNLYSSIELLIKKKKYNRNLNNFTKLS